MDTFWNFIFGAESEVYRETMAKGGLTRFREKGGKGGFWEFCLPQQMEPVEYRGNSTS